MANEKAQKRPAKKGIKKRGPVKGVVRREQKSVPRPAGQSFSRRGGRGAELASAFLSLIGKTREQLLEQLGEAPSQSEINAPLEAASWSLDPLQEKTAREKLDLHTKPIPIDLSKIDQLDILTRRLTFKEAVTESMERLKKNINFLKDVPIDQLVETIDNLTTYVDSIMESITKLAMSMEER
ncbi:MAG: hypothetical protein ACTSU5_18285 [Promethearchaeota archaeon]